ncbi:MAG: hypothetical protein IE933_01475 [Sphingomonadales bacterium]|nr:hypothetical protein [Sphingomonadales bacterium]MBD3771972.1 hypothetical protein [Paracoccaceae bacterium]
MRRLVTLIAAVFALAWSLPAAAQVTIAFHSFNGSMFVGRYPHAFIVLDGTLESNGKRVRENYGFSAKTTGPAVLAGPVDSMILIEDEKWLTKTNTHFTIPISDETYHRIIAEKNRWDDSKGMQYNLGSRNCIHFVGRMAQIVGLQVDYPKKLLRKPRAWLNHIALLNPKLDARQVRS